MAPPHPGPFLLFDVDGTLVASHGAGRRALEQAMSDSCGFDARSALGSLRFDGMTDRLIVRAAFRVAGRPYSNVECAEILTLYEDLLVEELRAGPYEVLPGARELLEALRVAGAALGLGTGNVVRGAQAKLARGGLDGYFSFGGYAEDGETRGELLRAAVDRAGRWAGRPVTASETIVIGDTPLDVAGAHAVGCRVFAVATGRFGVGELEAAGADRTFASLADPAALAALLG